MDIKSPRHGPVPTYLNATKTNNKILNKINITLFHCQQVPLNRRARSFNVLVDEGSISDAMQPGRLHIRYNLTLLCLTVIGSGVRK